MLKNFKIGSRLGLAFGLILALLMMVGGYALKEIHSLNGKIEQLVTENIVKAEEANKIIDQLNVIARALRNLIIDDNKEHQRT